MPSGLPAPVTQSQVRECVEVCADRSKRVYVMACVCSRRSLCVLSSVGVMSVLALLSDMPTWALALLALAVLAMMLPARAAYLEDHTVRVSQLWLYPVKSCGGVQVSSSSFGRLGFRYDRQWMVVNADTRHMATARELPHMGAVQTTIDEQAGTLTLSFPLDTGMGPLVVPLRPPPECARTKATVWLEHVEAVSCGEEAAAWITRAINWRPPPGFVPPVSAVPVRKPSMLSATPRFVAGVALHIARASPLPLLPRSVMRVLRDVAMGQVASDELKVAPAPSSPASNAVTPDSPGVAHTPGGTSSLPSKNDADSQSLEWPSPPSDGQRPKRYELLTIVSEDDHKRAVIPQHDWTEAGSDVQAGAFADGFPFLLASESSLTQLNQWTAARGVPVEMRAMRPNIVVSGRELPAWSEDLWRSFDTYAEVAHEGQQKAQPSASFFVVKPCARCIMTTLVWPLGARSAVGEPLRSLREHRKILSEEENR
jgi:uncharacterized protein YcbX